MKKTGIKKRFFLVLIIVVFGLYLLNLQVVSGVVSPPDPGLEETCEQVVMAGAIIIKEPPPEEEQRLEIDYPSIQGIRPVIEGEDILPNYIRYIFYLAITVAGLIAFGSLVFAGFKYLTSAGNPTVMSEAKGRILAGILGLIILLGSVLLLNTINPRLTRLTLEPIEALDVKLGRMTGVYLISDKETTIETNTEIIPIFKNISTTRSIEDLALLAYNFDNKTQKICFQSDWREDTHFNAVLHTDSSFRGECRIFYDIEASRDLKWVGADVDADIGADVKGKVSSVTIFTKQKLFPAEAAGDYAVKLFKAPGFDEEEGVCVIKPNEIQNDRLDPISIEEQCGSDWNDNVHSLIVGEGWVFVAFEEDDGTGKCQVFASGRANKEVSEIRTHYIGRCKVGTGSGLPVIGGFFGEWKPCISSVAIYKGWVK